MAQHNVNPGPNGKPGPNGNGGVVSLFIRPKNDKTIQDTTGKIRCFAGGEWKPREEFSNRQLEKFARANVPPHKSEISCRAHSTQIRRELKCEGPCAKWHPIENFSRSTRNHSKTWCMNCTDWQLSVEPGFAPYVPPSTLHEDEEEEEIDDDDDDDGGIIPLEDTPGERIEDWIQGNPSELGDFDRVEVGTQPSIVGGSSVTTTSRPSLLDTNNRELGGLPEALSAVNLGRVPSSSPSYASVATASTVRGPASTAPRSDYTPVGGSLLMSDADTASQTNRSVSNTLFSDNSRQTSGTHSHSVASSSTGGDGQTLWMENRFADLSRSLGPSTTDAQRASEARNGWARPVQRKTNLVAPRYVSSTGGMEIQPQKKTVYADADDDDSEDEC